MSLSPEDRSRLIFGEMLFYVNWKAGLGLPRNFYDLSVRCTSTLIALHMNDPANSSVPRVSA